MTTESSRPDLRPARHRSPGRTSRRVPGGVAKMLAIPVALVASGGLVWHASYAAFTATTDSRGNSWTAGSVALHDDDGSANTPSTATAMFNATGLKPGSTGENCLTVTYDGSIASGVKLYIKPADYTGSTLASY